MRRKYKEPLTVRPKYGISHLGKPSLIKGETFIQLCLTRALMKIWLHFRRNCKCSMSFSVRGFLHAKAELGICIFPVGSVTNFHRIGGFKTIQIDVEASSPKWYWRGCFFWISRKSYSLHFPTPAGRLTSLVCGPVPLT